MENDVAEFYVAGLMVRDVAQFRYGVSKGITEEHFSRALPREIFLSIKRLDRDNTPIDYHVVGTELLKRNVIKDVREIYHIESEAPIALNIDYYFDEVLESGKKLKLSNAIVAATTSLRNNSKSTLDITNDLLNSIVKLNDSNKFNVQTLPDIIEKFIDYYEGDEKPYSIGLKKIDDKIPYLPSTYNLIGARLGVGKTTFLINALEHLASNMVAKCFYNKETKQMEKVERLKESAKVMFFSLEMNEAQTVSRLGSQNSGVPVKKIIKKSMNDIDTDKIMKGFESLCKRASDNFYYVRSEGITVDEIRSIALQQYKKTGLDVIVIDYIQIVQSGLNPNTNEAQKIAHVSQELKRLSMELGLCIIGLVQTNRGQMQGNDKRPKLSMIGGSDVIARDADSVLFLHRESYENDNSGNDNTEAIVAKSRHGDTGTVLLKYNMFSNKLEELED